MSFTDYTPWPISDTTVRKRRQRQRKPRKIVVDGKRYRWFYVANGVIEVKGFEVLGAYAQRFTVASRAATPKEVAEIIRKHVKETT